MDFDELDALEDQERQRWALQELEKAKAVHRKRAAQEQFRLQQQQRQQQQQQFTKPPAPTETSGNEVSEEAQAFTSGLASFHLWAQTQRDAIQKLQAPEKAPAPPAHEEPTPKPAPKQRRSRFAEFQQKQQEDEGPPSPQQSGAARQQPAPEAPKDPFANFAERLMVHSQADREIEKTWVHQQLSGESLPVRSAQSSLPEVEDDDSDYVDKVPALNTMIAILDKQEEEEHDFERWKPYLPELGEKAPRSLVPVAKDGSNPFITQAVQVFQQYYPDFDLSDAFGDNYKSVLRAATHRVARGGRVEQLQLMNVGMAEEERRLKEERRNLLRDLRRRRYLLQEGQRALGVNLSNTKLAKAPPRPLPVGNQARRQPPALRVAPAALGAPVNGLLFPGMDASEPSSKEPEICFPRPPPLEPDEPAAKPSKQKPLGLTASLRLEEDEDPFSIEDLTGLPPPPEATRAGIRSARPVRAAPGPAKRETEEADRERRAAEQAERLQRLKERRLQKEKAKAVEAVRSGKGASWGPVGEHLASGI